VPPPENRIVTHSLLPALLALGLAATAPLRLAAGVNEHGSSEAADAAISASMSAILQGDSTRALRALAAVPVDEYRGFDAQYRACMSARFERRSPPWLAGGIEDRFVQDVLHAYQDYWWRALAQPPQREALTGQLLQRLRALLGDAAAGADDFATVEPLLIAELERRGYHALMGRTPPLRELMLWRNQESREFDVTLPDGPQRVHVELLDDFLSLGWSAYGRCERGSNGGWATGESLYAVMPAYRTRGGLEGERFKVVFLGHEAQHLADKDRFTGLADWELEYRAKLVELAQAGEGDVGQARLRGFISSQGNDMDAPHPYANTRVIADLRERLGAEPDAVPRAQLHAAALELLARDTRRLEARGAARPAAD